MAGYDWSKGKSNNAVWAEEEEGMRTKSKLLPSGYVKAASPKR